MFNRDLGSENKGMFVCHVFDEIVQDKLVGFLEWVQSEVIKDEQVVAGDVVQFFEVGTIGFVIEELGQEFCGRGEEDFKALDTSGITQGGGQE